MDKMNDVDRVIFGTLLKKADRSLFVLEIVLKAAKSAVKN